MMQPAPAPAGPSAQSDGTGDRGAVALSIQPVIVYSSDDQQRQQSHHPTHTLSERHWLQAFPRESKLLDISPDGQPTFDSRKPSASELRDNVRRLWSERGDFSRFSTAALAQEANRKQSRKRASRSHDTDHNSDGDDRSRRSPSYERDAPNYLSTSEDGDDIQGRRDQEHDTTAADPLDRIGTKGKDQPGSGDAKAQAEEGGVRGKFIDEHVFTPLWTEMLGRLDHAHVTAIHAHQLVGMLLQAYKSRSAASASSLLPGRSSSPAPSGISASATVQAKTTGDDFVLDPLSIGVSRIKLANPTIQGDDDEQDDDNEDHVDDNENAIRAAIRDASSNDAQRLFDRKVCLAQKRASLLSAAEVLRTGAKELRASQGPERERWRGLRELKQRGWGLTPGRPLNDQYGAAHPNDEDALPGLEGFGTPIFSQGKIKDEGARDAWIGFGTPEASVQQRRRTLAYWMDAPDDIAEASDEQALGTKDRLVLPYRPKKRLRASFILQPSIDDDDSGGGDGDATKVAVAPAKQVTWTSDHPNIDESTVGAEAASLGGLLDKELQAAQQEFADEDTFRDIVHQSRMLGPAFDVRLTGSSVVIEVTPQLDLVFELVKTASADDSEQAATMHKATPDDETAQVPLYSPFASMALAFARFAPLRKHLGRREAAEEARTGDVFAKAQALRAQTLAVLRGRPSHSQQQRQQTSAADPDATTSGQAAVKAQESGAGAAASIYKLNVLGPIFSIVHYASFVYRLDLILATSAARFDDALSPSKKNRRATYTLSSLSSIANTLPNWLSTLVERGQSSRVRSIFRPDLLFQLGPAASQPEWMAAMGTASARQGGAAGGGSAASAAAAAGVGAGAGNDGGGGGETGSLVGSDLGVGGQARVFVEQSCVAIATVALPSKLVVQFPLRHTPQGRGLTLSLDLPAFQQLLDRELQKAR